MEKMLKTGTKLAQDVLFERLSLIIWNGHLIIIRSHTMRKQPSLQAPEKKKTAQKIAGVHK
jgi:hypothetical protein